MNAGLSKVPGLAVLIFSVLAALAWLSTSSGGALAAPCASVTFFWAGSCCLSPAPSFLTSPPTERKLGSCWGDVCAGSLGGAGQAVAAWSWTLRGEASEPPGPVVFVGDEDSRPRLSIRATWSLP